MLLLLLSHFSCVRLLATPWTAAYQLRRPWDFPGKNTGMGCCTVLQGTLPIHGSDQSLLHWQAGSLPLNHLGKEEKGTTEDEMVGWHH